jgi:hypothetical protein
MTDPFSEESMPPSKRERSARCAWCHEEYPVTQLAELSGQRFCPMCTSLYHGGEEDDVSDGE